MRPVGRIEIYLKSRIAYLASEERGPFCYPDVAITRLNSACPSRFAPLWATQPSLAAPPIRCSRPILIGCEVFGFGNLPAFFIVCVAAYLFNMDKSIYALQKRA